MDVVFTKDGSVNTLRSRLGALDTSVLPHSYKSNSTKEELALEYAENFRRQFVSLFPERRPLLLFPKNECGVRKLVCTTLRPTQLQYRELYNLEACARFTSQFLDFEPVEEATRIPSVLPSPSFVMRQQVGDSFGFANVLCSLLVGAGYDAYVVCGFAPEWVTMNDETWQELPTYARVDAAEGKSRRSGETTIGSSGGAGEKTEGAGEKTGGAPVASPRSAAASPRGSPRGGSYEMKPHGIPKSKFLESKRMDAEEAKKAEAQRAQAEGDPDPNEGREIPDCSKTDPLHGRRYHAWVMVSPHKRDVDGYKFVEATTGRIYPVESSPYLGIEALWNHRNYWVNMQNPVFGDAAATQGVGEFNYDLTNTEYWEYVFIDPLVRGLPGGGPPPPGGAGDSSGMGGAGGFGGDGGNGNSGGGGDGSGGGGDGSGGSGAGEGKSGEGGGGDDMDLEHEQILDLPPSWVAKLALERERFRLRYGTTGSRINLYIRSKVELFAENVHEMGLVRRTTVYEDLGRTIPRVIVESFVNRRDKLYKRVRSPLKCLSHEYFHPGRPAGLKEFVNIPGRRRVMRFYLDARLDGLLERTDVIGKGMTERFRGRDDRLRTRRVNVDRNRGSRGQYVSYLLPSAELGELAIVKMVERFDRARDGTPAEVDVATRTFFVAEGRATYAFHYDSSQITATTADYYKDESKTNEYSSKYASSTDPAAHKDEVAEVWAAEKACYGEIRNSERETSEVLQSRRIEEGRVLLDRSVFETASARAQEAAAGRKEDKEEEQIVVDPNHVEYLTPFLQDLPDPSAPSREQASRSRTNCLAALKERLLERADIIQKRLDDENQKLAKKQAAFQRSRDHVEGADEEFEQFCSKAMFTIQILEQRLAQHEVSALQKYADMDAKLRNDPRLGVLLK